MTRHISCDCKYKFNSTTRGLNKKIKNEIIKHITASVKLIVSAKKIIVGILEHTFVRIVSI